MGANRRIISCTVVNCITLVQTVRPTLVARMSFDPPPTGLCRIGPYYIEVLGGLTELFLSELGACTSWGHSDGYEQPSMPQAGLNHATDLAETCMNACVNGSHNC